MIVETISDNEGRKKFPKVISRNSLLVCFKYRLFFVVVDDGYSFASWHERGRAGRPDEWRGSLSLSRHWRAISVNNYYYSKRVVVEVVEWEGKKKMVRRRHKVTTTFSPTHRCRRHREKKERKRKKNSSFSAESRWRESAASRTNERYANWFDVWRKGKREREKKIGVGFWNACRDEKRDGSFGPSVNGTVRFLPELLADLVSLSLSSF